MPKRKCVFGRQTKNAKKQANFRNKYVEMNNQNTYCSSVISEHNITLSDSFHSVKANQQKETPICTYSIILSDSLNTSLNTTPISEYDITLSDSPKTPTNISQYDPMELVNLRTPIIECSYSNITLTTSTLSVLPTATTNQQNSNNTTPISEYDITLSGSPKTPTNTSQHDTNDIILSDIPKNLTNIDNKVVLNKKNKKKKYTIKKYKKERYNKNKSHIKKYMKERYNKSPIKKYIKERYNKNKSPIKKYMKERYSKKYYNNRKENVVCKLFKVNSNKVTNKININTNIRKNLRYTILVENFKKSIAEKLKE